MDNTRKLVLRSFKKLHRTSLKVFVGDLKAVLAARQKINEEYKKNKHVKDEESIKAMIKFSDDIGNELKTQVIQAQEVKPGVYEARITADTLKLVNVPFNDQAVPDDFPTNGPKPCCQDQVKDVK